MTSPLVTHDVAHLQDVDWWIFTAASYLGPMRHVHAIRRRRRIRLLHDVLVKFVRFSDSNGDERVSCVPSNMLQPGNSIVSYSNLCHGPAIGPCSGKTITKAPRVPN